MVALFMILQTYKYPLPTPSYDASLVEFGLDGGDSVFESGLVLAHSPDPPTPNPQ